MTISSGYFPKQVYSSIFVKENHFICHEVETGFCVLFGSVLDHVGSVELLDAKSEQILLTKS